MAIVEKIFLHSKNTPNNIAIVNKNEKISYARLSKSILAAASELRNQGIKKLDYVLLSSPNSYSFICIYMERDKSQIPKQLPITSGTRFDRHFEIVNI